MTDFIVKRIRPKPNPYHPRDKVGTQCEMRLDEMAPSSAGWVTKSGERWRVKRYANRGLDPDRCVLQATIEIDGRKLCSKHAGMKALEHLMGEKL